VFLNSNSRIWIPVSGGYPSNSGSGSPLAFRKDLEAYPSDFGSGLRGLALGFRSGPVGGGGSSLVGILPDSGGGKGFCDAKGNVCNS
jgi:hypothetical protein